MEDSIKLHFFKNKIQILVFTAFGICYYTINIISTSFFGDGEFGAVVFLHSFLYALGGAAFSFIAYRAIKMLRTLITSDRIFLIIAILCVYIATIFWMFCHHLSWWLVSGGEFFAVRLIIYPIKALIYSIITLAVILLLILSEKKSLTVNQDEKATLNLQNVQDLFEKKKTSVEDTILLPVKNRILNIKIDSIKLIQANDYYSNLISENYDKTIVSNYSLKKWEDVLPEKNFLRIHRSSIVNLNYVENIEKLVNNTYEVKIKGVEHCVNMSRRCAKTVLERFEP